MKVAILDARQGSGRKVENSYTIAYRNLGAIQKLLNADLFINPSDIKQVYDYDVIICGFGSMACEKDRSTEFLIKNENAKVFWLVGDYEQSTFAPLFYSKREFEVLATFGDHKMKNKMMTKQHKININALLNKKPNSATQKKYDCLYYGRWRPDRLKYFKQYLDSNLHLSTGSKNIKMFHHNGCNPKLIKNLTWQPRRETLNLFISSLWIEDEFSHANYTAPPNRFYEMLWCNCVPLIDKSCIRTLKLSGYADIDGWEWHIVENTRDITRKVSEIKKGYTGCLSKWQEMAIMEGDSVKRELTGILKASAQMSELSKSLRSVDHDR